MFRRFSTPVVALMLGLALGLGADALADRQAPPPAKTAAVNKNPDVVRELRALKRDLVREVGSMRGEIRTAGYTIRDLEREVGTVTRKLEMVNQSISGYSTVAGTTSLVSLLQSIDRNTR